MKTKNKMMLSGLMLAACVAKAQQPQPPAGQQPGPPRSPAEHSKEVAAKLEKDLTLSKEQSAKVSAAYQSFFAAMEKVRGKMKPPPPPPPPPMPPGVKKTADSLSAIRDEEIKKALTAEQFAKYKEVEKTMRPKRPKGQQGPPPPSPKQ
jgi:Spy/CpxP family protein refolding chaperone